MLTKKEFDNLSHGEVFATGVLPNSPEGLFMNGNGSELRWVATKGGGNDWAIYYLSSTESVEWIKEHGNKLHNPEHIKKCVSCEEEVFKLYRY